MAKVIKTVLLQIQEIRAAAEEQKKKVEAAADEQVKKLQQLAKDELHEKLKGIRESLEAYNAEADKLGLNVYNIVKAGTEGKAQSSKGSGERTRRSSEELTALAWKAVEFLKGKGKEGGSAGDLKTALGVDLKPTPADFVKKYANVDLKPIGSGPRNRKYVYEK